MASAAGWQLRIALVALMAVGGFAAVEVEDLVDELKHLRGASKDGVIKCDDTALKRFGTGKQRPYTLIVFLTARQVMDNPQLAMEPLRKEFGLMSLAVKSGPDPDAAFFIEVVFEEAQAVFHAVSAQQVPYIFRVPGNRKIVLTEFPITDNDKMTFQSVGGQFKYPWTAESMISYFARSGLVAGEVNRPTIFKSPWFPTMVAAALGGLGGLAYALWQSGVLHHPLPWAVGAIGIFWFSVSGGMYNIIRGMPMFMRDKNGKIQFFMGGRGNQLGAEGFIVGTGYILFSATVSLLTYAVPRVRNNKARNALSYVLVVAAGYMALKLFGVFVTKTGYRVTTYLMR